MSQILLIEPDSILASTYQRALEQNGHSVQVATNAQDGIFAVDGLKPDKIILELQLPIHSGIEFLYELRSYAEWQAIPVIAYTFVPPEEFKGSRELLRNQLGVQIYLYKPTDTVKKMLAAV